jgi:ABC-2 type transport system permease protein
MKRFLLLTKSMFLIHLRNGAVLFWNFAFPALLMVIYGLIMTDYMAYMTPGVIVLNLLSFGMIGSTSMMLEMREKGVLRRLQATPLPAIQLVFAYLLVNFAITLTQSAVILTMGVLLYKIPVTFTGLMLAIPLILAGVFTFLAMGGIVSGIAPKAGVASGIGMSVYFTLMFISDMVFPITMLPGWLQKLAPFLPPYPVVQLVRSALLDSTLNPNWPSSLLLLAIYSLVAAFLAAKLFRWEPKA